MSGKNSYLQVYTDLNGEHDLRIAPRSGTKQQIAVTDALRTTVGLWWLRLTNVTIKSSHGTLLSEQLDAAHSLSGKNYQGFSRGICVPDSRLDPANTLPLAFPLRYTANNPATAKANMTLRENTSVPAIIHPGISRAEVMNMQHNGSQYEPRWIDLPQPSFNGSSIGAVLFSPHVYDISLPGVKPQEVFLCNFAAGSGLTTLGTHTASTFVDQSVSSKVSTVHSFSRHDYDDPLDKPGSNQNVDDQIEWYPQLPITITREWAQYLNPLFRASTGA